MEGAMDARFWGVGLLCADLDASVQAYQRGLGSQVDARQPDPNLGSVAWVSSGCDVLVELLAAPLRPEHAARFARHGPCIDHITFAVGDLDLALANLTRRGVAVAWGERPLPYGRDAGFYDSEGAAFRVLEPRHPPAALPPQPEAATGPRLHHVSLLTTDLRRAQRFYTDLLGLRTLYEHHDKHTSSFVLLADAGYDDDRHTFVLEIMGPPSDDREIRITQRRGGPCWDHLGYTTPQITRAHAAAVAAGLRSTAAPARDQDLDITISWLHDADGNDVELMDPFPLGAIPGSPAAEGSAP
jgi:catechol 2,3-dioxygenase-like lactoylglutathione lyase family enzyme